MRKRLVAAACLIAPLIGLAGCAGSPNTVAQVGDERITTADLDETVGIVERAFPRQDGQQVSSRAIASTMIGSAVAEQVAERTHTRITPEQREAFIAAQGSPQLAELAANADSAQFVAELITPTLVAEQLGPDRYLQLSQQIPVEINPAYGEWDYTQGTFAQGVDTGSLSVPANPV